VTHDFIDMLRERLGVEPICKALQVAPSAYRRRAARWRNPDLRSARALRDDRPGLGKALGFLQPGDVLVVWKLDRLGRSLPHLLDIVNSLKENQVGFRSIWRARPVRACVAVGYNPNLRGQVVETLKQQLNI